MFNKGFIDGDEYWSYSFNPKIVLSANEFKEFMTIYNKDIKNKYQNDYDLINDNKEMKELFESHDNKLLEWW